VPGQVGEVQAVEGVFGVAVGVVVEVGWGFDIVEQVELLAGFGRGGGLFGGLGWVGDVGVDGGGMVGEQFDAVGE
jgi:hypothetical protein